MKTFRLDRGRPWLEIGSHGRRVGLGRRMHLSPGEIALIGRTVSRAPILVAPARYVRLSLAEALTGYTVKAMERKIERGGWVEGKVWIRAPDGRIVIDILGYYRWVEGR